jgi:hypothetical protein
MRAGATSARRHAIRATDISTQRNCKLNLLGGLRFMCTVQTTQLEGFQKIISIRTSRPPTTAYATEYTLRLVPLPLAEDTDIKACL